MTIEIRAIRKAVELMGTRDALAERLGVKVEDVEAWISGVRRPVREVFLRVVDLILDEIPAPRDSSYLVVVGMLSVIAPYLV
ncbi:MAG TPA: YdaS family helix-turn-helix protein [Burkholderiales bacterium]|nr:YdaS family helix-turn-helix protein [Burkholderiales bacterium]